MSDDLSPRKLPRQARSRALVDAILEATARLLVAEGYEAVTTNRIAEVAGVSIGSLYQYFPSLGSLVVALYDRLREQEVQAFQALATDTAELSLEEASRALLGMLLGTWRQRARLMQQLALWMPKIDADATHIAPLDQQTVLALRAFLALRRADLRELDEELAAYVLAHAVMGICSRVVAERPEALEDPAVLDELVRLTVGYLAPYHSELR